MTTRRDYPPGALTEAEFDRIQAAAAARGENVCIDTVIIPDPSPIRGLVTTLFPALTRQPPEPEPEPEIEP